MAFSAFLSPGGGGVPRIFSFFNFCSARLEDGGGGGATLLGGGGATLLGRGGATLLGGVEPRCLEEVGPHCLEVEPRCLGGGATLLGEEAVKYPATGSLHD